jgi:hypothetical protein
MSTLDLMDGELCFELSFLDISLLLIRAIGIYKIDYLIGSFGI